MKRDCMLKRLFSVILLITMLIATLSGCASDNHDNEVKPPQQKSDLIGKNYEEVVKAFENAGFTNIETEKIDDLIFGWFTKDGEVESVTIDGSSSFSTAKWYPKDAVVHISYHTYPEGSQSENQQNPEPANDPSPDPTPSIEYTPVSVAQMLEDLDSNALKAKESYKDQYLEITGKLNNIDASGKYISLISSDSSFGLINVQCYVKSDYQKSQIAEMKTGDIVTLRGKCTSVGEVMGYSFNIDSIDGYEPSNNNGDTSTDEYITVTAGQLVDDLDSNAMKAKNTYEGKNIIVTGKLSSIDSDGKYITIEPVDNPYTFTSIMCYIKTNDVKAAVMELKTGAKITVKGKCTSVGEVLVYSITIESIEYFFYKDLRYQ